MSSYAIIRQGEAVHAITDGASYNPDGTLRATDAVKCLQLGHMPAIVTSRGPAKIARMIAETAASPELAPYRPDFEMFLTIVPEIMPALEAKLVAKGLTTEFEVVFAGWLEDDERLGIFHWRNTDVAFGGDLGPARTLNEITHDDLFAPMPDVAHLQATGFHLDSLAGFDPEHHGLQLIEAQRRVRAMGSGQVPEGTFLVGGQAMLTTVTRDGVTQKRLKQWSADKVGGKIRPELVAVVGEQAPLSRQQRRAMERQEHKAGRAA